MLSVAEIYATVAHELALEEFVVDPSAQRHYACDEEFAAWFAAKADGTEAWTFSTFAELGERSIDPERALVVCTRGDERARRDEVQDQNPSRSVFGLLRDVLPCCAAQRPLPRQRAEPSSRYMVVCTPRSGSYFLCGLLASSGLGAPREHLLTSVCELARGGHLCLTDYLEDLAQSTAPHDWFGTKIISHKLFDGFARGMTPESFVEHAKTHHYKTIYLRRNDKVGQAVSNFFARATNVWRQKDGTRPERPNYDYAEIATSYDFLVEQEQWIETVVSYLPDPLTVEYENLERDTAATLASVLTHLGADPAMMSLRVDTQRQRDELSERYVARFLEDRAAADR